MDVRENRIHFYGAPIYVRKEIVRSEHVVDDLRRAGGIFVEELGRGSRRSAGQPPWVSPAVREEAKQGPVQKIDATCPLVTRTPGSVRFAKQGHTIVLEDRDHDEVTGTLGEAPGSTILVSDVADVDSLQSKTQNECYLTQTTLSLDETKEIVTRSKTVPSIQGPEDAGLVATQPRTGNSQSKQ